MPRNFWTFQAKERISDLFYGVDLEADFDISIRRDPTKEFAYRYLLDEYNRRYSAQVKGLIFGFLGSSKVPDIPDASTLWSLLEEAGEPSGSIFSARTHSLLHVRVPDDTPFITCDFYRFSDLIFAGMGEDEYPELFKQYAVRDLFKPNGVRGEYELIVGHLPCIKASWPFLCYPATP